MHPNQIFQQD
jgi:3-hydroxyacyl-[acyl-carrier-protein] dehydratase